MKPSPPYLSRTRLAVVATAALALLPMLALALLTGDRPAGALPAQFTTRSRPSTTEPVSTTTEPEEETTTTTRARPRTTERRSEPEPTKATRPVTTARPASTRRSTPQSSATTATTTFPTLPPSTNAPELLVAGPVIPEADSLEADQGGGVSTSAALRWVIIGLVLVGLALGGLTVAYWLHTRPRRDEPWSSPDDDDDGDFRPPGAPASGFTALARGGAGPYRPPGQVGPADHRGDGGGSGASTWSSSPGGTRSWEPAPPVSSGEAYEEPWGSS